MILDFRVSFSISYNCTSAVNALAKDCTSNRLIGASSASPGPREESLAAGVPPLVVVAAVSISSIKVLSSANDFSPYIRKILRIRSAVNGFGSLSPVASCVNMSATSRNKPSGGGKTPSGSSGWNLVCPPCLSLSFSSGGGEEEEEIMRCCPCPSTIAALTKSGIIRIATSSIRSKTASTLLPSSSSSLSASLSPFASPWFFLSPSFSLLGASASLASS
mmetsp:Transcript_8516/g.21280  ORF Transcript_8516/g.21280 Transcript_8516/m.21280 type:complete len:219 (+) Transcript_8516:2690-3346(+)